MKKDEPHDATTTDDLYCITIMATTVNNYVSFFFLIIIKIKRSKYKLHGTQSLLCLYECDDHFDERRNERNVTNLSIYEDLNNTRVA